MRSGHGISWLYRPHKNLTSKLLQKQSRLFSLDKMINTKPKFQSALQMASDIKEGKISSRDLVEQHIERIEEIDTQLNAVVDRDFRSARAQADLADKHVREGKSLGVFHGVPCTIKEAISTPGFKMTAGHPYTPFRFLPAKFSTREYEGLVQKGGAILMGKTNIPMSCTDWDTNNPVYGQTFNPWDIRRSPGGSSGGSAVALATGMSPLEIGSDLAGSVRVPAAMCGVIGHCSTFELYDHMVMKCGSKFINNKMKKLSAKNKLARTGAMGRTVDDVETTLKLIAGEENCSKLLSTKKSTKRIAFWRSHDMSPPSKEVSKAFENAKIALWKSGYKVEEISLPFDPSQSIALYMRALGDFTKNFFPPSFEKPAPVPKGVNVPFHLFQEYLKTPLPPNHSQEVAELTQAWEDYLAGFDAVLSPITPCEPWVSISEPRCVLFKNQYIDSSILVDGVSRKYLDNIFWPHLQVICGLPATGFPVHISESGLPVGLQAFGRKYSDLTVLNVVRDLVKSLHGGSGKVPTPPDFS